jgi:HSP90 family molecular chaperone
LGVNAAEEEKRYSSSEQISPCTPANAPATTSLNFDVSTGLNTVLGWELITDDEVAIFELVKNSFDAGARTVEIFFRTDNVVVADNGSGMSYDDLKDKWLFVAYSSKRRFYYSLPLERRVPMDSVRPASCTTSLRE